jgi:haloacetate dehalogenase
MTENLSTDTGSSRRDFLKIASVGLAAAVAQVPSANAAEPTPDGDSPATQAVDFFPGFEAFKVKTSTGIHINGVKGGSGPPVLLIHGAPCNLVNWRKVAPALAENYTIIATDLRGYGDSDMPEGGEGHMARPALRPLGPRGSTGSGHQGRHRVSQGACLIRCGPRHQLPDQ